MLTKAEKENRVIELYEQGKVYREIAKEVHMSPGDISSIVRRHTGETNGEQKQQKLRTIDSEAFTLFEAGRTPVQVAIELDLKSQDTIGLYKEWWQLKGLHDLIQLDEELGDEVSTLVKLYKGIKNLGLSPQQIARISNHLEELPVLEGRYNGLKNGVTSLVNQKQDLLHSFGDLSDQMIHTKKILDGEMMAIDHHRKEIESLVDEKQQLEKFISRLKTNSEEYSKVARILKEKVTQVLNDKRMMLSAAIGSILQALKENPEKQLLIYDSLDAPDYRISSIPLVIDSRQYRQLCMKNLQELAEQVYDKLSNHFVDSTISSALFFDSQAQP